MRFIIAIYIFMVLLTALSVETCVTAKASVVASYATHQQQLDNILGQE